jgi:hypothetical protein
MFNESQENNFKATFRKSLRTVFYLLSIVVNSTLFFGQKNLQVDNSNFDKQKWLSSSDYRYEIVKCNSFPSLEHLSKKQIIRLLGQPNFKNKHELRYCFDISNENKYECESSFLTINLSKKNPPKYRVTLIWVEPLNKE